MSSAAVRLVRLAKQRVSSDRTERKLTDRYKEENRLRYYLKTRHPNVWRDICDGAIFDEYDHYKRMMKEEQKQQKR